MRHRKILPMAWMVGARTPSVRFASLLFLACISNAAADDFVVDQAHYTDNVVTIYGGGFIGQEFRPTMSTLDVVDVELESFHPGVSLNVREGTMTGPIVGSSSSVLATDWRMFHGTFAQFDFATPVSLVPEQVYVLEIVPPASGAIVGVVTDGNFQWREENRYTRGRLIGGGEPDEGADVAFRTGSRRAPGVVYRTGFEDDEQPALVRMGYQGWQGSPRVAVSGSQPHSGASSLLIPGSALALAPSGLLQGGISRQSNLRPLTSGNPIVEMKASVRLDGPSTNAGGGASDDLISANLGVSDGGANIAELLLSSNGYAYAFTADDAYNFETPATLGEYHTLGLRLNYLARTTEFFLDERRLGALPFPRNAPDLFGVPFLGSAAVNTPRLDPAQYSAWFDDFSISQTPVPEPTSLVGFGIGAAVLAAGMARCRRRRSPRLPEMRRRFRTVAGLQSQLVLGSTALAIVAMSAAACQALPPPTYLPVHGGPTYSPETGGYLAAPYGGGFARATNAGTVVAIAAKLDASGNGSSVALRWSSSTAPVELGLLRTDKYGVAQEVGLGDVNDDGTTVGSVGIFDASGSLIGQRAARWDASGTEAIELGDLGADPTGRRDYRVSAINAAGAAVGIVQKFDDSGNLLGGAIVRWDASGNAAELAHLGSDWFGNFFGEAYDINDAGVAVGTVAVGDASGNDSVYRAVRWDATGAVTELASLSIAPSGYSHSEATLINNAGTIVGTARKNEWNYVPVRWDASGSTVVELGCLSPELCGGSPIAMNRFGAVVGAADKYDDTGTTWLGRRAVRWDPSGAITELGNIGTSPPRFGTTGWLYNWASAINDAGTAVGFVVDYDVNSDYFMGAVAVYWGADGVPIDLNTLIDPSSGWHLDYATDISRTGWIVGQGLFDPDGLGGQEPYERHFLMHVPATAVPEPSALVLSAILTALLAPFRLRASGSIFNSLRLGTGIGLVRTIRCPFLSCWPMASTTMTLISVATSAAISVGSTPSAYFPVYGGPTYSPEAGGYRSGGFPPVFVNNAAVGLGTTIKYDAAGNQLGVRAVRWDASGAAPIELGNIGLIGDAYADVIVAVALNEGGTALGRATKYDGSGNDLGTRAVRWDATGVATELGVLGTSPTGFAVSEPYAINDAGAAVGTVFKYDDAGNYLGARAVRWRASGTAATELGHLGSDQFSFPLSQATDVNVAGTAVGGSEKYDDAGNFLGFRAVRWDASSTAATELGNLGTDPFGRTSTSALAVNDAGTIIGHAEKHDDAGKYLGYVPVRWNTSDTLATELGNLGVDAFGVAGGFITDLNRFGAAVGSSGKFDAAGNYLGGRPARWDASGAVTELGNFGTNPPGWGGTPGVLDSSASAVNDAGVAVGGLIDYRIGSPTFLGSIPVYWGVDGQPIDLNTLIDPDSGWEILSADDISNTGWITGVGGYDPDGPGGQDGYMRLYSIHVPAAAVPEPATTALGLVGLAMANKRLRQRRIALVLAVLFFPASYSHAAPVFLNPAPYLAFNNTLPGAGSAISPFAGLPITYFHLETFEDGLLNTPGVTADVGVVIGPIGITDSVDSDDGAIDDFGGNGHSMFNAPGDAGIRYNFNAAQLGQLPTHVGIVWTDGATFNNVTLEAFGALGASLGTRTELNVGDGNFNSGTAEDRFFGVIDMAGISAIRISSPGTPGSSGSGIEVDHLQYGLQAIPEPNCIALFGIVTGLLGAMRRRRRAPRISIRRDLARPFRSASISGIILMFSISWAAVARGEFKREILFGVARATIITNSPGFDGTVEELIEPPEFSASAHFSGLVSSEARAYQDINGINAVRVDSGEAPTELHSFFGRADTRFIVDVTSSTLEPGSSTFTFVINVGHMRINDFPRIDPNQFGAKLIANVGLSFGGDFQTWELNWGLSSSASSSPQVTDLSHDEFGTGLPPSPTMVVIGGSDVLVEVPRIERQIEIDNAHFFNGAVELSYSMHAIVNIAGNGPIEPSCIAFIGDPFSLSNGGPTTDGVEFYLNGLPLSSYAYTFVPEPASAVLCALAAWGVCLVFGGRRRGCRLANGQIVIACIVLLTSAGSARAVTYKATLLHPADYIDSFAQGVSGGSQVGYGRGPGAGHGIDSHALLWNSAADSKIDLHPAGFNRSVANGVSSAYQVGWAGGGPVPNGGVHAHLWNGTATSAADLHPLGFDHSYAEDVSEGTQVGWGIPIGADIHSNHALLWSGTAASAVDLHPAGFDRSVANAVSGPSQVGLGAGPSTDPYEHALLWNGTAASVVDLHPVGLVDSKAEGVWGGTQVGWGWGPATDSQIHALLWNGTAASVVDLHPVGFESSRASGVSGGSQVGWGEVGGNDHALLWNGTAASVVDLHPYLTGLGPNFTSSGANYIAENGTIVGEAVGDLGFNYAVLWTPVPEPASAFLFALAALGLVLRFGWRKRRSAVAHQCLPSISIIPFTALLTSATLAGRAAATPPHYRVTDFGTLGGTFSEAFGIDASRQATGRSSTTGDSAEHLTIIVGSVGLGAAIHASAFFWDTSCRMRNLRDVLASEFSLGASLAGWSLQSGTAVSTDGQVVVGYETNPDGDSEAWIARLAPRRQRQCRRIHRLARRPRLDVRHDRLRHLKIPPRPIPRQRRGY